MEPKETRRASTIASRDQALKSAPDGRRQKQTDAQSKDRGARFDKGRTEGAGSAGPAAADAAPPPAAAPAAFMETEPVPASPLQPGAPTPAPVEEPPTSPAPGAEEPETPKVFVVEELVSFKEELRRQNGCFDKLSVSLQKWGLSPTASKTYKEKFECKVEGIFEKIVGEEGGLDQRVTLQGAFELRKVQSVLPEVLTARQAVCGAAG